MAGPLLDPRRCCSAAWLRRDRLRLVAGALLGVLVVGCSGSGSAELQAPETSTSAVAVARDYWPTDGWRTAAPEDHDIDPAALAEVDHEVASSYPQVRSVLVVRHGYLVYEHYWHGLDETSGHDLRSATKSVTGALVGIAIAEGKLESLDQTVGELLAPHLPKDADPRFPRVTVKELLTMTSGLAGDDASLGGDEKVFTAMLWSPDWVRHILSRPLETEPGEHFAYSSAGSHLLSAIVADISGKSTLAYARTRLFDLLGISTDNAFEPVLSDFFDPAVQKAYREASVAWPVDPQGYHFGGGFLRLPARDLAKFGYLYLNGGRWEDFNFRHWSPTASLEVSGGIPSPASVHALAGDFVDLGQRLLSVTRFPGGSIGLSVTGRTRAQKDKAGRRSFHRGRTGTE
jgi:CubicO group peptidase (beta-lactamase class C family)